MPDARLHVLEHKTPKTEHELPPSPAEHLRRLWSSTIFYGAPHEHIFQTRTYGLRAQVKGFSQFVDNLVTSEMNSVITRTFDELRIAMHGFLVNLDIPKRPPHPAALGTLEERVRRLELRVARLEQRPEMPMRSLPEGGDPFELFRQLKAELGDERFLSFTQPE